MPRKGAEGRARPDRARIAREPPVQLIFDRSPALTRVVIVDGRPWEPWRQQVAKPYEATRLVASHWSPVKGGGK